MSRSAPTQLGIWRGGCPGSETPLRWGSPALTRAAAPTGQGWERVGGFAAVREKRKETDGHTSKNKSARSSQAKPKPVLKSRVPL